MSEPTPTLDAYIKAGHRVAKAWEQIIGDVAEEVEHLLPIFAYLNDQGYAAELMFPNGNEEWDIFV